jgi:hypothetical protein
MTRDEALRFLDHRITHFDGCAECRHYGWVGACGWNDPDPLTVIPDDPEPEPLPRRRDFALILAAAGVLAIIALVLLLGGTRV